MPDETKRMAYRTVVRARRVLAHAAMKKKEELQEKLESIGRKIALLKGAQ